MEGKGMFSLRERDGYTDISKVVSRVIIAEIPLILGAVHKRFMMMHDAGQDRLARPVNCTMERMMQSMTRVALEKILRAIGMGMETNRARQLIREVERSTNNVFALPEGIIRPIGFEAMDVEIGDIPPRDE